MSIFERLYRSASGVGKKYPPASVKQEIVFTSLPENLAQMQMLPEASLASPYQTAALTVCALCAYGADRTAGAEMLNWLRGPRPLSGHEISFLNDRFRDGFHVPFSYFRGAIPDNDYTPTYPFVLVFEEGPYADANPGYKKLHIRSGGADNPREIILRQKGNGQWFLWEQYLLVGIRPSKSEDPWA